MTDLSPPRENDHANVMIQPPYLWLLTLGIGYGLHLLLPLPFIPADWPQIGIGASLVAICFFLAFWGFFTFRAGGTQVETHTPTSAIVETGPFAFSRNPIYIGLLFGLLGSAVGLNTAWILIGLIVWYPIMRYGVIAREEAYLEAKFGEAYTNYKSRVRRWL